MLAVSVHSFNFKCLVFVLLISLTSRLCFELSCVITLGSRCLLNGANLKVTGAKVTRIYSGWTHP